MKIDDCPVGTNDKKPGISYGAFHKITYYSRTTHSDRQANILLPPDYSPARKYPVLYFLHGIFCDEDSLTSASNGAVYMPVNLALEGKIKEMIIVCPNIYAQDEPDIKPGFYNAYFHGYNNFMYDLINDLMPFMEQHYSVAPGRENTAVCGFSMGGRTALYIVFKRPDLFGYVGAFSPAPGVVPGKDQNAVHTGLFSEDGFRIQDEHHTPFVTLISCGTKDSVVCQFPKTYHDILTKNSQPHHWIEVPDADHDDRAIRTGLYAFISLVFQV